MSAFDKVIGYETTKNELLQICDMIHNREIYEELGAKLPQGILLYGNPGLVKTLMAKSFIEESGFNAYIVRRNKGAERQLLWRLDDLKDRLVPTALTQTKNAA